MIETAFEYFQEWRSNKEYCNPEEVSPDEYNNVHVHFIPEDKILGIENNLPILDGAKYEDLFLLFENVSLYHYSQRAKGNSRAGIRSDKKISSYLKKIDEVYDLIEDIPYFAKEMEALTSLRKSFEEKELLRILGLLPQKPMTKNSIKKLIEYIKNNNGLDINSLDIDILKKSF